MYNWAHNEKCECFVYCVLQFWNRRTLPAAQWRAVLIPSANLIPVLKCIWYYNSALQAGIPNGTSCSYVHFVRCIKLYQLGDEGQRGQKKWGSIWKQEKPTWASLGMPCAGSPWALFLERFWWGVLLSGINHTVFVQWLHVSLVICLLASRMQLLAFMLLVPVYLQ